jgi:hypothetical protein
MADKNDLINLAADAHLDEPMEELLASYLRRLAKRLRDGSPDRSPEFAEGVKWAAAQIDQEADA